MAEITASLVKELREITGTGMMECKKALVETEGNIDAAIDYLRTKGLAAAQKKAGRATNEGLIVATTNDGNQEGALIEVNCETDFVARNEKFVGFAKTIAGAVLAHDPADLDALKASQVDGQTIEELLTEQIHTIGENIQISRFQKYIVEGSGYISTYIHGEGKLGIMAEFDFSNASTAESDEFKTFAKDIAMQVAAANPIAVSRDTIAAGIVEHEMDIYKAQAEQENKPAEIQEKIATGRLEKFYKENTLLEQPFIKDNDIQVQKYLQQTSKSLGDEISIVRFERFVLGENV